MNSTPTSPSRPAELEEMVTEPIQERTTWIGSPMNRPTGPSCAKDRNIVPNVRGGPAAEPPSQSHQTAVPTDTLAALPTRSNGIEKLGKPEGDEKKMNVNVDLSSSSENRSGQGVGVEVKAEPEQAPEPASDLVPGPVPEPVAVEEEAEAEQLQQPAEPQLVPEPLPEPMPELIIVPNVPIKRRRTEIQLLREHRTIELNLPFVRARVAPERFMMSQRFEAIRTTDPESQWRCAATKAAYSKFRLEDGPIVIDDSEVQPGWKNLYESFINENFVPAELRKVMWEKWCEAFETQPFRRFLFIWMEYAIERVQLFAMLDLNVVHEDIMTYFLLYEGNYDSPADEHRLTVGLLKSLFFDGERLHLIKLNFDDLALGYRN
ncbi:unnamed protein product [Caenorhabditis sp. 36 PRJEB53466]|nr:unnamed protein product [Caenorhabditis sp. 36 PRJEB53466]